MKTFKEFLAESSVVSSRRQGIEHLENMKPVEFVSWLKSVEKEASGVLKNYKTVMKVDGLGARFGKDERGNIFFEGSRTGPIFTDGAFSEYAKNKGSHPDVIARAQHYDDMLRVFKTASFMSSLPNNTKVYCEIFYNPIAEEQEDGIVFVTVKYDKNKLGSLMTILPYSIMEATSGDPHPEQETILKNLYSKSSKEIKIVSPNLSMSTIDINAFIDPVKTIERLEILTSRKSVDKEEKMRLISLINQVKKDLAKYLLNHPNIEGKFNLGPEIEGIVLHVNDRPFKITTDKFRDAHKKG